MIALLPFQKEYTSYVKQNWIYDCDTGVGKTYMGLWHYSKFYGHAGIPLLIVAPASKITEGGWQRLLDNKLPEVAYEMCSYNLLPKRWKGYADYFVIYDECHRIKNSTGVWGKSAYFLSKVAVGFICLSATPIPNDWEDSINYFKMFSLTKNKTQFLNNYAYLTNIKGYQEIIDWKKQDELTRMWQSISKRMNKSDAIDLPELIFKEVRFSRSKDYQEIIKTRVLNDVEYDNQMKLRHGLRQHCNLVQKISYLTEFIENTTDNIVIFYNYDIELEVLKPLTDYVCNGYEKNYPKKEEWDNIKNTVTIANYKSGAEAVEFTFSPLIIYFSPTESYTEFYQSYGRCHRVGQNQKVTAYKFITQQTIEVDIYKALDNKKDFNYELWMSGKEDLNE